MSNELASELKIQREIDRIVDTIIALLPPEAQTQIMKKEVDRREKTRVENTLLEARREVLEKEWEALEAEKERQRKRRLQEWQQLMDELQHLPASVPKAGPLFRHLIELVLEWCQEMPISEERVELMKKINEKRNEQCAPFHKELEELAEKMV